MRVYLNNEEVEIKSNQSLFALLNEKEWGEKPGIAVAVNSEVVSKEQWSSTVLNENDKLMIITATAGG